MKFNNDFLIPNDTIKVFLDDTSYYIENDYSMMVFKFTDKYGYLKYFNSTGALDFELKDGLPDGFYCLYNITKKQAKKIKNIDKYFVASGRFQNGKKEGPFIFYSAPDKHIVYQYKIIFFKNNTVDGYVKEIEDNKITYFCEYKMGKKDGFVFIFNCYYTILLYQDDKFIKLVMFDEMEDILINPQILTGREIENKIEIDYRIKKIKDKEFFNKQRNRGNVPCK